MNNSCARRERKAEVILTRDRALAQRKGVQALLVMHDDLDAQLAQVIRELALATLQPGTRCVHCNEPLLQTTTEEVAGDVPAYVLQTQTVFHRCPACGRVFWRGTHWRGIEERLRTFD